MEESKTKSKKTIIIEKTFEERVLEQYNFWCKHLIKDQPCTEMSEKESSDCSGS